MSIFNQYLNNLGFIVSVAMISLIILTLLYVLIKNQKTIRKNPILKNLFVKRKSIWVQRLFLTFTLIMIFFNFFSTGYTTNQDLSNEQIAQPLSKKGKLVNNNENLYKGLYAKKIQDLQLNEKQYFTSFKDLEALGSILQDINASYGGITDFSMTSKNPLFDQLYTDVLNYTFINRDVNSTKFFFNSTSNTVFVAQMLDHFGLSNDP